MSNQCMHADRIHCIASLCSVPAGDAVVIEERKMNTPVYVTIISSLLSGIIGIIVSSWFYSRMEKRKLKTDTARRLLGYRYHVTGEGFTTALNEAFIIFADNQEVVKAIENFHVAINSPGKPDVNNKLLYVFKAICKDVSCLPKDINDTYFLNAFNITK